MHYFRVCVSVDIVATSKMVIIVFVTSTDEDFQSKVTSISSVNEMCTFAMESSRPKSIAKHYHLEKFLKSCVGKLLLRDFRAADKHNGMPSLHRQRLVSVSGKSISKIRKLRIHAPRCTHRIRNAILNAAKSILPDLSLSDFPNKNAKSVPPSLCNTNRSLITSVTRSCG